MTASPPSEKLPTLHARLRERETPPPLAEVIEAIVLAGKAIAYKVRRAGLDGVIGELGVTNVQGEVQQKLDVLADDLLLERLRGCASAALYASEEREEAQVLRPRSQGGAYCVLVDPLDGSSNIDVAVPVGTIFSILPNERPDAETARAALQPGSRQLAAGYLLYGSCVALVLALPEGVDFFVLDPQLGEFLLVERDLRIPDATRIYSINEAYRDDLEAGLRHYLDFAHASGYSSRYIGSMVADVHRTLLKGGVFLYPRSTRAPQGKLRLLYEGNPMAFVIERAGGLGSTGSGRILEVSPEALHQRTPVILGSATEVEHVTKRLA